MPAAYAAPRRAACGSSARCAPAAGRAAYAYRLDATTFGVFDTFADESGRTAHLHGQIAAALGDAARTKLVAPADIRPVDLLGVKMQGSPS